MEFVKFTGAVSRFTGVFIDSLLPEVRSWVRIVLPVISVFVLPGGRGGGKGRGGEGAPRHGFLRDVNVKGQESVFFILLRTARTHRTF
jgi:hypothetical protein